MKRFCLLLGIVLVILGVAACGDDEEQGVSLQAAGQGATPTPTLTPEPATEPPGDGIRAELSGRLLYLKGRHFEMLDLESGEVTRFEGAEAYSSAVINADRTRGVFVAFPDFGVIDLETNEVRVLDNTGSTPNQLDISPDGRWMATSTGNITARLEVTDLDGGAVQSVASATRTWFAWTWTVDSRLVWADAQVPDEALIYDPAAGVSEPLGDALLFLTSFPNADTSPDGSRMIRVPVMMPGNGDDAAGCFDSYVGLIALPMAPADLDLSTETLWTESGLIASSPQWRDDHTVLFVRLGSGACGELRGDPVREILLYDVDGGGEPRLVAGPIGNTDDPNDEEQRFGRQFDHLYSPSPDGAYVAWVDGGIGAGETAIRVTHIETGETSTAVQFVESEAVGAGDFIDEYLIRQVVWLE